MFAREEEVGGQSRQTETFNNNNLFLAVIFTTTFVGFLARSMLLDNNSLPSATISEEELVDFPDCGERDETYKGWNDECLWTCSWKENPHYRKEVPHTITKTDGTSEDVLLSINIYKIPDNLSCMDTCNMLVFDCSSFDDRLDCYIWTRSDRLPDGTRRFVASESSHVKAMTCYLARLDTSLYPGQTCNIPSKLFSVYYKYKSQQP